MSETCPSKMLEPEDLSDFQALTGQESFSVPGQVSKMKMIEEAIRMRIERDGSASKVKMYHTELADGRYNLIVELGDTVQPVFSVMIPAHIDTVYGEESMLQLRADERDPDKLTGLGVYDMGGAVLNNIALASTLWVPVGMKVYIVFTVDEEEDSLGAGQIVAWEKWPEIKCILSSEIGPVPALRRSTDASRLILARAGREKFFGSITVNPGAQGHGAQSGLPNASDAMMELVMNLRREFYGHDGIPLRTKHYLLGDEAFETGEMHSLQRQGYMPPHAAKFVFSAKTVPRDGNLLEQFRTIARLTAEKGTWDRYGINYTLGPNEEETCYPPYSLDAQHRLVQISSGVIKRVAGIAPELVGAPSVADECLFAADMLRRLPGHTFSHTHAGVITIPINGDHAHHPKEWVSQHDIRRVRHIIRELIESTDGFRQLLK